MERKYIYEINFVRAIACLLVVMVHVSARFYYAYDGNHTVLTNYLNQIARVGTPLFAVMSGFLLYNQALNRKFNTVIFLKSRLTKIVIPFIFWSIFYLVYKSMYGSYTFPDFTSSEEVKNFLTMFLLGKSHYHLYFIVLVIQFYILFLFIRKALNLKTIILFTIISSYLNYTFITNKFLFSNVYIEQFVNSRAFLFEWIYYFMLGILLVELWPLIYKYLLEKKNSSYVLLIGAVIMLLTIFDYYSHEKIINSNQNFINMLTVPIVFIVLVSLYNKIIMINDKIMKVFIKIGNMSMGIFLIHPFVIYLYRDIAPYDVTAHPLLIFPYFIAVIGISIVLLKILSLMPYSQYIITLVETDDDNVNYNIGKTKKKIKKKNQKDYISNEEKEGEDGVKA